MGLFSQPLALLHSTPHGVAGGATKLKEIQNKEKWRENAWTPQQLQKGIQKGSPYIPQPRDSAEVRG